MTTGLPAEIARQPSPAILAEPEQRGAGLEQPGRSRGATAGELRAVQHVAEGDMPPSILPLVVTLANVDEHDLRDLKAFTWTEIAWDDEEGRRREHAVGSAELNGRDLRCMVG